MRNTERTILLCPGPVTMTANVSAALTKGVCSDQDPEFAELTRDINERLVRVYREMARDFRSVLLTGSGDCAVEAMLASFAPAAATTLVIVNGRDGSRLAAQMAALGRPHAVVAAAEGAAHNLDAVRDELTRRSDITHVAMVHHETSPARLNDLAALGELCAEKGLRLLLDCVSSFGAESIDADKLPIAALAATADRCLQGASGASFVLARRELWAETRSAAGSAYLDLHAYYAGQHGSGYSPVSQAVQPMFALLEALRELEDLGGWEQRRSIYRVRAGRIAVTLKKLGLSACIAPQEFSCGLWSWQVPTGDSYARIHAHLKSKGFILTAAEGESKTSVFRVAHMGDIQNTDLDCLTATLRQCFDGSNVASLQPR